MKISIVEAAELIGGDIIGSSDTTFSNVAKIEEAQPGDLTFLYLPAYQKFLDSTKASAVIVSKEIETTRDDITYIVCSDPKGGFQKVIEKYFTSRNKIEGIDPSASVSNKAELGNNVAIGKNVVISEGCKVGDNTVIQHNTVLLENVSVGSGTLIYPNVTIREDCTIGSNVIIHANTVIGSDGFGYAPDDKGVYHKVPQIGNVVLEDDVEIGSNVSIDRAAMGSTIIKNGTKIDNLVQIAHNVAVGSNTVISAQTGISGSTKIGNNCILAGQVGTVGHIELADGVIIGAQSGISKSITKPGKYFGYPAKEMATALRLESHVRSLPKYAERIKELEKKIEELEKKLGE